ncbi:MAG: four helix bundle protein [Myxococcota bacterium]|nr:four helix bundle protein [Myxococcota bacterium]
MQDFRRLEVWRKAHALTLQVYGETVSFPVDERYGLTRQMRRSAASIGTNLAEGCGRRTRREYAHFVSIARGSSSELEYQILLAADLGYLSEAASQDPCSLTPAPRHPTPDP